MRPLLLLLTACATTTSTAPTAPSGPRGMRADAHLQAARAHEARAAELARWPEMQRDATGFDQPAGGLWYRSWDSSHDEQRLADMHRSEASRLQAAYDEACAGIAASEIGTSPFQRHGLGSFASPTGVTVMLTRDAGPPERLLAAMRCHRAWMMLAPANMEDCPLDLPGIAIHAYGDETGISVEIRARSPEGLAELQRRAARDIEHSMAHSMHR